MKKIPGRDDRSHKLAWSDELLGEKYSDRSPAKAEVTMTMEKNYSDTVKVKIYPSLEALVEGFQAHAAAKVDSVLNGRLEAVWDINPLNFILERAKELGVEVAPETFAKMNKARLILARKLVDAANARAAQANSEYNNARAQLLELEANVGKAERPGEYTNFADDPDR